MDSEISLIVLWDKKIQVNIILIKLMEYIFLTSIIIIIYFFQSYIYPKIISFI